jgi:hypothetical protein
MIFEFLHLAVVSVAATTYFVVSLKNGAPGSSSTVRVDHDGAAASFVGDPRPVVVREGRPLSLYGRRFDHPLLHELLAVVDRGPVKASTVAANLGQGEDRIRRLLDERSAEAA